MKIGEASDKYVRITLKSGQVFEGVGDYLTSGLDNPNGVASICVGMYELYENEIDKIEEIT